MAGKLGDTSISLQNTKEVVCEKCGCQVFEQGVMLREISALMTGTGQPGLIPIPVFVCSECGHVNEQFIPAELRTPKSSKLS